MWQQIHSLPLFFFIFLANILTRRHLLVYGSVLQSSDSLYHSSDNVVILTSANVTQFVVDLHQDGQKLQLIQFYNSYCGHCIAFAPTYKKFLKSVVKWKDLISFSAVDCSIDANRKVCGDFDVMYYPTLRMFWFKPSSNDHGEDIKLTVQEVPQIRQTVLKWITDNWKKGNIPTNWPQFDPLTGENKNDLINRMKLDNRTAVIVVEGDSSFTGREIMMDLSRYTSEVHLYRMVESDIRLLDQILPQSLDNFKLPFLMTINGRDREFRILPKPLMSKEDDQQYFVRLIKQEFIKNAQPEVAESEDSSADKMLPNGKTVKYSERVFMSDLHNAIRYALFHEVPMRKNLNTEQTNALIRFLDVLYVDFHFQNDKTKQFVKYLHDWLEKKLNDSKAGTVEEGKSVIDVEDMLTTMNMYEDYYHFPEMKPWRACADVAGGPKRSYPCSLWSLFHVLTVAEYRESLRTKQWSSLHAVLYAMREYVRNFFGCTECAQHFISMSASLENELVYPNSSVLWLWQAHNKVNARLKGSASEVAQLPKRQFPTHEECPHCYLSTPDEQHLNDSTKYRQFYDEPKVLQFLTEFYAAERLVPDNVEFAGEEGEKASQASRDFIQNAPLAGQYALKPTSRNLISSFSPFTSTDYSIMFIFYVVSITLLVSLCAFFKIRRNRNNRKSFALLPFP